MIQEIAHLGLVDEQEIELDAAALEIASLDHPDVDLEDYIELLESMTEQLLGLAVTAHSPIDQAAALAEVIAIEFYFRGDRESYDDPANADLISVIDRRRGMPIALSILYVAIARRIGWTAHALNTPGHVLVSIGEEDPVIVDPFSGGAVVETTQLSAMLRNTLGSARLRDEHVAPMSNRAALLRLLMNQATRAERAGDLGRALTVHERIMTIAPAHSSGWWELARLQIGFGRKADARNSLTSLLETTRDPFVRAQANSALDALIA